MRPDRDLRVAVGFLTRVPVGDVTSGGAVEVDLAGAVPWFPLVGAGVGLSVGGAWRGLVEVFPPFVAATLAVAAGLLLTGAFHHDGLADMADAFGGGWTVEQRFEILRDSRLGTYGSAALAMALLVEVAALASLPPGQGLGAAVAAHAIGRSVAVATMVLAPVAGDGLGAAYMRQLRPLPVAVGVAAGLVVAVVAGPVLIGWPILGAAVSAAAVVALAVRKVGGVTGDVLGAVTVLGTLAALVAMTAGVA